MPENPNVIALAGLMCRLHSGSEYDGGFCPECYVEAEALASQGVLVVSDAVLTDEALSGIAATVENVPVDDSDSYSVRLSNTGQISNKPMGFGDLRPMREALSRLAKGEAQ